MRSIKKRLLAIVTFITVFCLAASAQGTHLVISQVYGGGGNSGATYKNDFIEIFNPTNAAVSVNGWSVQYASSTGTTWAVTTLSGSIPAGGYYLVQESAGTGGTANLPTPNATGTLALSATAGKVALVGSTTALSGCPAANAAVDVVSYGTGSTCYEGSGPTATLSNTTAAIRINNGCTDTDNNSTDFTAGAPNPRNSSSPLNICGGCSTPTNQPTALTLSPSLQTISGSFTAAAAGTVNADAYLVLVSTSSTLTDMPQNGTVYAIDDVIGNGVVVSVNSSTSFTAKNLTPGTTYYFFVFAVGSTTNCYNTTNPLTGTVATNTPPACSPPTVQASNLTAANITGTSMDLNYTRGNGDNILIIARNGSGVNAAPINSVNYTVGTEIGSGNFVVYNGPAATFTYSSLAQNTTYYFALYEYNNANYCYTTSPLTGNFTTACTNAVNVSSLNGSAGNGKSTLVWNNPTTGCFDQILVVASTSPVNGSASSYTGTESSAYNNGNNVQVVYRGLGTSVTITGLTNGTTYYFKVFTRNGSNYSNGVQITVVPFDPSTGFQYLYGNLHAHSSYSDGNKESATKTPLDDFQYARDANCMDFLGISEHNHSQAGMSYPNFALGYNQANQVNGTVGTTGNSLITLYGMEWGVISGGGHVVVYGFDDKLIGWESGNYDIYVAKGDYASLWNVINSQPGAFGTLAHPNSTDYSNIAGTTFSPKAANAIVGVAVESGPAMATTSTYNAYPSSLSYLSYYKTMLAKGYHVGATMDHDNHYMTFGKVNTNRLVVLATSKTRAAIMDAMRNNRFYASEDCNVRIDFKSGSTVMGSSTTSSGVPNLSLTVTDPDAGETVNTIELWGGQVGSAVPASPIKTYTGASSFSFGALDLENTQPNNSTYYYFTITTQGDGNKIVSSPIWYTRNDLAVLPVTLLDFKAQYQPTSNNVLLTWTTAQEVNLKEFVVERSTDNGTTWTAIGAVAAAGNSNITNVYNYADASFVKGINLYRLRQMDQSNSYKLSNVAAVNIKDVKAGLYTVYPNPAKGTAFVTSASVNLQRVSIEVIDANGKSVRKESGQLSASQPYRLNLNGVAGGMYFIKLTTGEETTTERLMIQ